MSAQLQTAIWRETARADDPFAAEQAWCHGYDLYGKVLGRATPTDLTLLLLTGERPAPAASRLLADLAVALANPGPRDASVHAAMSSAVGGSPAAATLMAALSVGAGQDGGGRDVALAMHDLLARGHDLSAWAEAAAQPRVEPDDVWPAMDHEPGFEPHGRGLRGPVRQTLAVLAPHAPAGGHVRWLGAQAEALGDAVGRPLSLAGVAAATYLDLGLSPTQGELLHLLLRLPGAAAHALEQAELGFKAFPFPEVRLLDDPDASDPHSPAAVAA